MLPHALPPSMVLGGVYLQLMADSAGLPAASVERMYKGGQGVIGAGWHGGAKAALQRPPAPRAVILHMPRDDSVTRAAQSIERAWRAAGAEVLSLKASPIVLGDAFFSDAIAAISPHESAAIVAALRVAGYLSGAGFLLVDPQRSAWRSVVSAPIGRRGGYELGILRAIAKDDLSPFSSPIAEELSRAFALGEVSAEFANRTFKFLASSHQKKKGPAS